MAHRLHRVCLDVVDKLSLCGATITVMTHAGGEALAAASNEGIQAMVEVQFALGEGPSSESFSTGRPVLVPDLSTDAGRWLGFTPVALAAGVIGVYAFPLGLGAIRLGVLTCYTDEARALGADELRLSLMSADAATELLLSSSPGTDRFLPDPEVQESLQIRSEVYQAQGMMTVELGINLSDALARLRAMAFAEEVDLNELATDLVTGRRAFPERNEGA